MHHGAVAFMASTLKDLPEGHALQSLLTRPECFAGVSSLLDNSPSYRSAMAGPERDQWSQAIDREMHNLESNDTFEIVPRAASEMIIRTHWHLRKKRLQIAMDNPHRIKPPDSSRSGSSARVKEWPTSMPHCPLDICFSAIR